MFSGSEQVNKEMQTLSPPPKTSTSPERNASRHCKHQRIRRPSKQSCPQKQRKHRRIKHRNK